MDSVIVVSEPTNFTVSVVLSQNNLDPGTEISLNLVGRDGVATGMTPLMCIGSNWRYLTADRERALQTYVKGLIRKLELLSMTVSEVFMVLQVATIIPSCSREKNSVNINCLVCLHL